MKFKVGDRVKCVWNDKGTLEYLGLIGVITNVCPESHYPYRTSFAPAHFSVAELELITNDNIMIKRVGSMMKRILDADTNKLVKAGLINGDLDLTDDGQKALMAILFTANKAALVAEADEIIAEEEK